MFSIKQTTTALVLIGTIAIPLASNAQDYEPEFYDEDVPELYDQELPEFYDEDLMEAGDAVIAAATGWHLCDVKRTGAGWGNHYAALTCPQGPFTNKWHILENSQKEAMLATALTAATSDDRVQVYIAPASSGYNVIRALYLYK